MKISLYLSPSKYWWAYLAIRSNRELTAILRDGAEERVIFFDDAALLPGELISHAETWKHFFICWDGLTAESEAGRVRAKVGEGLTVLVVGETSLAGAEAWTVRELYPSGELNFRAPRVGFDARTTRILFGCRVKTWLMPLKNLRQSGEGFGAGLDLLAGKKKIVFCGSYGTIPKVISELCTRHAVDRELFIGYRYYEDARGRSLESYCEYLVEDGRFLADLFDRGKIPASLLLSAVHLLGREYFVERIRSTGMPLFAHGYASGVNINVYTTPFYRQHVFLDFGSAVGKGNYPRLADLRYFKKKVIAVAIESDLEQVVDLARSGRLAESFEKEWARKSPVLIEAMR